VTPPVIGAHPIHHCDAERPQMVVRDKGWWSHHITTQTGNGVTHVMPSLDLATDSKK
jgi:hypothetical protein